MSRHDAGARSRAALLAAAFTAMFVAVGTGFSYGVLVLPAARDLGTHPGVLSGAFALTVMVFFAAGAPAGVLADRLGARAVLAGGALALGSGLLVTASAPGPEGVYLGHGLLVGLAMATSFVPLTAAVGAAFSRRRNTAVGVAVSGIGLGTLVVAPVLAATIAAIGWRDGYLLLAAVATPLLLGCAALVPGRPAPAAGAGAVPADVPSDPRRQADYRRLYLAQALLSVAIFTPFAHLPAYAEVSGVAPVDAAGLVGLVGGASVVGRLALGVVAERLGLLASYRGCFAAVAGSFVLWLWPGAGYPALAGHAVVLGLGYGGFVALLPGLVVQRFGPERLGGLLGVLYTSHVVGAGLGPLATGLLVARYGYLPAGAAGLGCGLAALAVLGLVRGPGRAGLRQGPSGAADQARPRRR